MELTTEDSLRLNVLLHQQPRAIRIDESQLVLHALTDKGEAHVTLNPNCAEDRYIRQVRALLSTHFLDSPGGYPVHLKRWTRMGQAREESLDKLLLLGEPEAVVAVVHAAALNDELAARAWWAMPSSENARRMLERAAVVNGETGPTLAAFLLEFLPFEEDPRAMLESVRLVLQPGLISDDSKRALWSRARSKRSYYVGFLHALPDALPGEYTPHPMLDHCGSALHTLAPDNPCAALMLRVLSHAGQGFVHTTELALKKPSDQYVVESLFDAIERYFSSVRPTDIDQRALSSLDHITVGKDSHAQALLSAVPAIAPLLNAARVLACVSADLLNPIFSKTDAIGTVMRKKIAPVSEPIFRQLEVLKGAQAPGNDG